MSVSSIDETRQSFVIGYTSVTVVVSPTTWAGPESPTCPGQISEDMPLQRKTHPA